MDNFYCVENQSKNPEGEEDFKIYCELRTRGYSAHSPFYICKDCSRRWLNESSNERGSSGINIHWPITDNKQFQEVLDQVKTWENVNNLSPIVRYSIKDGCSFIWFGDMETTFMESIKNEIKLPKTHIVFAPHHGRESGTLIKEWLDQLNPTLIIVGEAPSANICYYPNHDTITQNSAGDITFNCHDSEIDIYVESKDYAEKKRFNGVIQRVLPRQGYKSGFGWYVGTIVCY
jgi:hypothetical protein